MDAALVRHLTYRSTNLAPAEIRAIHRAIGKTRPETILEFGTGNGRGTTQTLVRAVLDNHCQYVSRIHTCEPDRQAYDQAKLFHSDRAKPRREDYIEGLVSCHFCKSTVLVDWALNRRFAPRFVLCDGSYNPAIILPDLKVIEPHLRPGSIIALTNWNDVIQDILAMYFVTRSAWEIIYYPWSNSTSNLVLLQKRTASSWIDPHARPRKNKNGKVYKQSPTKSDKESGGTELERAETVLPGLYYKGVQVYPSEIGVEDYTVILQTCGADFIPKLTNRLDKADGTISKAERKPLSELGQAGQSVEYPGLEKEGMAANNP